MDWTIHATVPYPMLGSGEIAPLLAESGIGPEIYFSGKTLDSLAQGEIEKTAAALRAAGVKSSTFHAPFEEIWPGARDEEARGLAVRRLTQVISIAPVFRPRGIVVHGGYYGWLYDFDVEKWFEPALRSFAEIAEAAEKADVDIFLENVFDDVPDHLLRLRSAVGSRRIGYCCDAAHATLFSGLPVHKWLAAFGSDLRELHLHDNRGKRDDHLPIGEGMINFRGVLNEARDAGALPILTLEPHRLEHFHRGLAALRKLLAELP